MIFYMIFFYFCTLHASDEFAVLTLSERLELVSFSKKLEGYLSFGYRPLIRPDGELVYENIAYVHDVIQCTKNINEGYLPLKGVAKQAIVQAIKEKFTDQATAQNYWKFFSSIYKILPASADNVTEKIAETYQERARVQKGREQDVNSSYARRRSRSVSFHEDYKPLHDDVADSYVKACARVDKLRKIMKDCTDQNC